MERLTDQVKHDLSVFNRCQLCGKTGDICSFRMFIECDDDDQPLKDNLLIICSEGPCRNRLTDHPRLYQEVPWSAGGPGKFMLLCGNCKSRNKTTCSHPSLQENGGEGLLVTFTKTPLHGVRMCFSNGTSNVIHRIPATSCEGFQAHSHG